jgi:hypothetical protein
VPPRSEPPLDLWFSEHEAFGDYFATSFHPSDANGRILEYRTRDGGLLWATEVTAPGAPPVSRSRDLFCVARNVRAEYVGRRQAKQGDLWREEDAPPLLKEA